LTVAAKLEEMGCKVNKSCGLHVHVAAPSDGAMRRLAIDYSSFEGVIDGLLPQSRRGNNNYYCGSLAHVAQINFARCRDSARLAEVTGRGRYCKLNFSSHWRHGTVEFRHHSGSVEGKKIASWVKLCLGMVEKAAQNPVALVAGGAAASSRSYMPIHRRRTRSYRRRQFSSLVLRPEGATRDEIFAATGWEKGSLSMVRFAREAGIVLRKVRQSGGGYRYYGLRQEELRVQEQAAAPVAFAEINHVLTLEGLAGYLEMTDEELSFWRQRRARFSASNLTSEAA
jgi:hypothetical protein